MYLRLTWRSETTTAQKLMLVTFHAGFMLEHYQYHYQYQSQIYLARASFVIKSEARLESEVLIVHVMVTNGRDGRGGMGWEGMERERRKGRERGRGATAPQTSMPDAATAKPLPMSNPLTSAAPRYSCLGLDLINIRKGSRALKNASYRLTRNK